jgi:hypothetical protein
VTRAGRAALAVGLKCLFILRIATWMSAPTCIQSDHMAKARLTVPSQPIALPGSPKADEA